YGKADLIPHLIGVCSAGAVDVTVSWGEPVSYDMSADRKDIARVAEQSVRTLTARARSMARPVAETPEIAEAPAAPASAGPAERLSPCETRRDEFVSSIGGIRSARLNFEARRGTMADVLSH